MKDTYILGIDQSTQGTKALLFDNQGGLCARCDLSHRQIVGENGWVEHDPEEIYQNTIQVVKNLLEKTCIPPESILGIGISNQRETVMAWERNTGKPVYNAIVWQCSRAEDICKRIKQEQDETEVAKRTGLPLSPYFSAAKLTWIMEHVEGAAHKNGQGQLCCGTMDSWLIYRMTEKKEFKTDYSNASRTQLFNINTLCWDSGLCEIFGIDPTCLAQVCDSDSEFGFTDLEGILPEPIPIHGVLGDSHGALFGQGCIKKGMVKATYGTGSSVMMNVGKTPVLSSHKIASSLAWSMSGEVNYVLEGNINYTGGVISWLKDDMGLISSAAETEQLAEKASPNDRTYLVPAFSGLGAPYWDSAASAIIYGMKRTTGKAEIVKAALDSIAYQITDIIKAMEEDSGIVIGNLRVDGGPTKNKYLMQFQSDIINLPVQVPSDEELSGMGAAYAAGLAMGLYDREKLFARAERKQYQPTLGSDQRDLRYSGWKKAVSKALTDTMIIQ